MMTERSLKFHQFQSTPLIRGETISNPLIGAGTLFQSTPLIRGETLAVW